MLLNNSFWQQASQRRLSRRGALGGVFAIGVAGLAACGANNQSAGQGTAVATGSARSASTAATPAGPPVKITASYVGSPQDAPFLIARDSGLFQKNALEPTLTVIPGPTAVAALLAGQVQAASAGAGEVLNAAAGGGELVIVAVVIPVFTFKFYAQKSITTPQQLKGKKIGITQPGGSFDQASRTALPKFGLDPDKDVTFVPSGSIPNVVAALISGSIDAAPVIVGPNSQQVEAAGLKPLFDFASLNLPNAQSTIAVSRSYLSSHHDVVQNFVDVFVEGLARFKQDKTAALQALGTLYKTNDQGALNLAYDFYKQDNVTPPLPYPNVEPLKNTQAVLGKSNPKLASLDISKLVDPSFVKAAADRGLNK